MVYREKILKLIKGMSSPVCPPVYRHSVFIPGIGIVFPSEKDCVEVARMLNVEEDLCSEVVNAYNNWLKVSYKTHYIVSISLIKDALSVDSGEWARQIELWQRLGMWERIAMPDAMPYEDMPVYLAEHYPTLPLYTGFFPALEEKLKDKETHGIVILDENYRAMTLLKDVLPRANMVYIDPPFATGREFAYDDKYTLPLWTVMMYGRMVLGKALLKTDAFFMLHVDQRADYIGRYLLEEVFGKGSFVNEIIWAYYSGGVPEGAYPRKHDSIYIYRQGHSTLSVPQRLKPKFQGKLEDLRKKGKLFEDDRGPYVWHNRGRGEKEYVYGPISDVWTDISIINNMAKERYGFRTQKPEALLKRLIESATSEGDALLDFFAGSGTTPAVAYKLKRQFVAIEGAPHGGFFYTHKGKTYTGMLGRLMEVIAGFGAHEPTGVSYTPYSAIVKVFVPEDDDSSVL